MKYGSVCSGIEAASVAWHHLGWEAQWFSEIEHFPSEVLKYRFPTVENLGDMTKLTSNETFKDSTIDLLVGGTPCQSFSVAGLRGGLADPRGNLMLTFLSLADSKKPRWIVWENVPGVLSSNGGKDFGTFLGALGELGYGFAYRVLDAQYFGVAQRRRRVFVVGYLGDWRVAAAVLFERESLQRNIKPSRKKRQEVASDAEGSVGEAGIPRISNALCARDYKGARPEADQGAPLIIDRAAFNQGENAQYEPRIEEGETMSSLVARGPHAVAQPIALDERNIHLWSKENLKTTPSLTATDYKGAKSIAQPIVLEDQGGSVINASDKGIVGTLWAQTHGHEPAVLQPIAVDWRTAQVDQGITQTLKTDLAKMSGPCVAVDTYNYTTNNHTTQTIRSNSTTEHIGAVMQPIAVDVYNQSIDGQTSATITEAVGGTNTSGPKVMHSMAIRRLTVKECERLQGFPDDWTQIPYRNKPADQCPDGPRYKACGNSMAVPVMRWIGERIQLIDTIIN